MPKNSDVFNTFAIDTIGFKTTLSSLNKKLHELKIELKDTSENSIINKYFLEKEINLRDDKSVRFAKISSANNLSGYILVKNNIESISASKKMKQAKTHYVEVVFAGLRQPSKKINMETYEVLSHFIKRFKIAYIDVCFDGKCSVPIDRKMYYTHPFGEYIGHRTKITLCGTTFYINNPTAPNEDADYFMKILLYDKYIKECRHKHLGNIWRDWKRIEFRVSLGMKLNQSNTLADYLYSMIPIAKVYFNTEELESHYFERQINWLTDRRTQGHHTP